MQDFPSDFTVPGFVDLHYNGLREVMQHGRQGKVLHAVHIRLEDGSSEGLYDFPSDLNVPGIFNMHHNSFREVIQDGRKGKALHAVYIRPEDGNPEGLQDFPKKLQCPRDCRLALKWLP